MSIEARDDHDRHRETGTGRVRRLDPRDAFVSRPPVNGHIVVRHAIAARRTLRERGAIAHELRGVRFAPLPSTMLKATLAAAAAAAVLLSAAPGFAHHSANAEFDTQKEMTITGVLTKLDVVNPHSWWYIEVKGPDGKVQSWRLESNSPAGLIRLGVKVKTDVKVGNTYSFRISPAWKDPDEGKLGWMRAFTINGKEYVLTEL